MEQENRKYIAIIAFLRKFLNVFFSLFFNIYILKIIHIIKDNQFKKCRYNIQIKFCTKCNKHFFINNI